MIEARSSSLPRCWRRVCCANGNNQRTLSLRPEDYGASLRVFQNVYSSGRNKGRLSIARLLEEKRALELSAITDRVAMDLRVAYYELLLNRAKIGVREQSVRVLRDELKAQEERFSAGTVGQLNVRRAEVSLGMKSLSFLTRRRACKIPICGSTNSAGSRRIRNRARRHLS